MTKPDAHVADVHVRKVLTVAHVHAEIVDPVPPLLGIPHLLVTAVGTVPTTGWTNGHLALREPAHVHGVYELDFVATPPDGVAGDVVLPIAGSIVIQNPSRGVDHVRVHAANGSKKVPIRRHQP